MGDASLERRGGGIGVIQVQGIVVAGHGGEGLHIGGAHGAGDLCALVQGEVLEE